MRFKVKIAVVLLLVIWTTAVAWVTVTLIDGMYPAIGGPERVGINALPKIVLFIAPLISIWQSFKVLRRKSTFDADALLSYFFGAPAWIFLALLGIVSLSTFVFAPITFVVGLFVGMLPLIGGMLLHCLGMVPLYFGLSFASRKFRRG